MIVAPANDQLLIVTQNDHAHFASELLSVWRKNGLAEHPRRRELLFAAREHDNGWREIDAAPTYHPKNGRPHDFMSVPRELRWEIWRRGTARFFDAEPYATLLILRHAIHLHRSHENDPDWQDIFTEWKEQEAFLLEATGIAKTKLVADYPWIDLTDRLSLVACNRWTDAFEANGIRAELRIDPRRDTLTDTTLTLDPFPLAGATTLRLACRLIPDRPYSGDTDLGTELAIARWQHSAVRVAPSDPVPPISV